MRKLLLLTISVFPLFLNAQVILNNDTTICVGDSMNLNVATNSTYNTVFNQTQSLNSVWTIGQTVIPNRTYRVTVSGLYSMWGNCINALDAAYTYNTGCSLNNCDPYNGDSNGRWYILGYIGLRPDNDVCGGNNYSYYYTIVPTTNSIQFSFYDNVLGDNSGSLNFKIEEVIPDSIVWSTGDSTSSINVAPAVSTTYYCTIYSGSQVFYDSVTVNVSQVNLNVNSQSICAGASVILSASGASTYSWMPGNLSGDSLSVSPTATTTYTVTGTDSIGCTSVDSVSVTVNPLPQVIGVSTSTMLCLSDANATLAGSPTPGTWSGPGVTGNSFNPATAGAGTHSVIYTYTDSNGCTNSDTLVMTVDVCTGITEENNSSFTIFPNPATNNITVTWENAEVKTLTLRDASGRAVRTYHVNGTQAQLSLEGLASGVYFLSANEEEKVVQKIIKN
jgi:Secretion system C-terminal sorting domain